MLPDETEARDGSEAKPEGRGQEKRTSLMERDRMAKTEGWKAEQRSGVYSVITRMYGTDDSTVEVLISFVYDRKGPRFDWRTVAMCTPLYLIPQFSPELAITILRMAREAESESTKPNEFRYALATVRVTNNFTFNETE